MLAKFPFPITPHLRLLYIMNKEILTKPVGFSQSIVFFIGQISLTLLAKFYQNKQRQYWQELF